MLIKYIDKFKNDKEYLVYGFYSVHGNRIFIAYEDGRSPLSCISENESEILDSTYSKEWIKYDDNTYLPEGWSDTDFLYELVDDLSPLTTEKFKTMKDKIDNEFSYYFEDNLKELQNPNILYVAEAIEDNWVLCSECNEAFEVKKEDGIIVCRNIACKIKMSNPYAKIGYPSCSI